MLAAVSYRLAGVVVKVSASRLADPGSIPACAVDLFLGSHTGDFKVYTPVATRSGIWRNRLSAVTTLSSVNIL